MATQSNQALNGKLANAVNNKPVPQQTPKKTMEGLLVQMAPEIKKAIGRALDPDRFLRIASTLYNGNPQFWQCDQISFLSALMQSAQLGLEPNTPLGHSYLIPYGKQVKFQMGYLGIIQLAMRSGEYKNITADVIFANDTYEFHLGLHRDLIHDPADIPEGEPIYYYATYQLQNGGENFVVWSRDKVIRHAKKFSKSFGMAKTPWSENFDSMAKKTCLIDLLKYAPKSVEVCKALVTNDTVKDSIAPNMEDLPNVEIDLSEYQVVDEVEVIPEIVPEVKPEEVVNKKKGKSMPPSNEAPTPTPEENASIDEQISLMEAENEKN